MRNNSSKIPSLTEKEVLISNQKMGNRSMNNNETNMSEAIGLFRKYLLVKSHNNIFNANKESSEAKAIENYTLRRELRPLEFGNTCFNRYPSSLEQKLFPQLRKNPELQTTSDNKSSKGQLTIFYSGTINVYDNVSVDKAQAIMLLAGESSLSNHPLAATNTTTPTKPTPPSDLPSVCKLKADLPIARKHSLQRFLEKRRHRIINKSPYASPNIKQENDVPALMGDQTFTPSPFPSLYFPVSSSVHLV